MFDVSMDLSANPYCASEHSSASNDSDYLVSREGLGVRCDLPPFVFVFTAYANSIHCMCSNGMTTLCIWNTRDRGVSAPLVSYPTRWSLLFVFGFLWWRSSWQWQPHIVRGKMLTSLLRAGLTVFGHFFCKMYFLWVWRSRRKNLADFFWVFPPKIGW